MSSFRRFAPRNLQLGAVGNAKLPGTKSWLSGQNLISTGCSDLDIALGGGLPLGSFAIMTEELHSNQMKTFEKLFISEGIHSKQQVLIISSAPKDALDNFITKLPSLRESANQIKGKTEEVSTVKKDSAFPVIGAFSKKQNAATLDDEVYCHSFDLSKYESDADTLSSIITVTIDETNVSQQVLSAIQVFVRLCSQQNTVGRIILDIAEYYDGDEPLFLDLFSRLRPSIRSSNCVLLALLMGELNGNRVLRYGDCVIRLQPWQDITPPSEFRDTVSLLHIVRLPSLLSLYKSPKSIFIYGVKRTIHSLRLSELRIPPEGTSMELF